MGTFGRIIFGFVEIAALVGVGAVLGAIGDLVNLFKATGRLFGSLYESVKQQFNKSEQNTSVTIKEQLNSQKQQLPPLEPPNFLETFNKTKP